jgi:hypothetical protein
MIEYMKVMKTQRLARELATLIGVRKTIAVGILRAYKKSQLSFITVMPELFDFCSFTSIKNVLEQPVEVDINESSFADIIPTIPAMFDKWRNRINAELVNQVKVENKRLRMGLMFNLSEVDNGSPPEEQ